MALNPNRKIVLVGKTGNGKSSLGNTLLRRTCFEEGDSFDAVTLMSKLEANIPGLTVVDTPGLFDTTEDHKKVVKGALSIIEALELCPNPHAFLIVLNGACRLTEEELSVTHVLRLSFGNEWLKHAIVVFTHVENSLEDGKFENKWKTCDHLRELVEECDGRVARIDNKNPREEHIEKIINHIEDVSNKGVRSYEYSYLKCHKDAINNAAELENYNGMATHQIVRQLAESISAMVRREIQRQEEIAEAMRIKEAIKEEERLTAVRIQNRHRNSALGSTAAGVITGIATVGVTAAIKASALIIICGSISSGGVVGSIVFGVLSHYYVR